MPVKTLGQVGYEAYRAHTGGLSLASGLPIPEWDSLNDEIKEAWEIAAAAICAADDEARDRF